MRRKKKYEHQIGEKTQFSLKQIDPKIVLRKDNLGSKSNFLLYLKFQLIKYLLWLNNDRNLQILRIFITYFIKYLSNKLLFSID